MTGAAESRACGGAPLVAPTEVARAGAASEAALATTARSVLGGGMWNTAGRLVPQLYTLVISVVAARYLGPDGMGRQSFIAFTSLALVTCLAGGLFVSLMRFAGEMHGRGQTERLRGLLRWAWAVEGLAAAFGAGVLVTAAALGAAPEAAWVLAGIVCALGVLHTLPTALLVGLQRFREASIVGLVTGLVGLGASIAVLAAGGGITGMFAVEAAISVVNLAWTGLLARRTLTQIAPRSAPAGDLEGRVARYAAVSSVSIVLGLVVGRRFELFFLARFSTDSEIALYSIAFAVLAAAYLLPQALTATIAPILATRFGGGAHERVRSGFYRAFRLLLLTTLPLTAAGLALGPELLRLLYGDEYSGTGQVLLVLFSVLPIMALTSLGNALLIGLGRARLPLVASGIAAAVDVALAAALVPLFGAVGAACANVGAQVALAIPTLVYAIRLAGQPQLYPAPLAKAGIAASAAGLSAFGAVWWLGGAAGVAGGAICGTLVFTILGAGLRILPAADAIWLETAFRGRSGRIVSRGCRLFARAPA